MRTKHLSLCLGALWVVACGSARPAARPTRVVQPAPAATQANRAPASTSAAPAPAQGLYAADEALRDVLSGRWENVGMGPWPGINRSHACAFRNQRVLIVNVYCTVTETQAFRVDVYSPTRGHVRLYAEAKQPFSKRRRGDYFTFTAESEPPPALQARLPALRLNMSFQELRSYDDQRYRAYLPACYGGEEHLRKREGCLGALAPRTTEWAQRNRAFLDQANDDWYRVVRELRAWAARWGRDPDA